MKFSKIIFIIIFLILISTSSEIFAQCPMCKASLESAKENGTQVGNTLNSGILYLLALPYTVTMVFGFIIYRRHKERKKQQAFSNQFNEN